MIPIAVASGFIISNALVMFTEEDRVVVKFLRQNKGYSARHSMKEFPLNNWNIAGSDKPLKKVDDTGSTARLSGNGRSVRQ